MTRPVLEEALSNPETVSILTYHPPIFSGLKSLTLSNSLSKSLLECVSEGVSVYTIHTAADVAVNGTNDWMASGLLNFAKNQNQSQSQSELVRPGKGQGVRALKENGNPPEGQEGCGMGRIVDFKEVSEGGKEGLEKDEIVKAVKQTLGLKNCESFLKSLVSSRPIRGIEIQN